MKMNILIIEDDILLGEALQDALIAENYQVTCLGNTKEFEDITQIKNYDVLIIDLNLPGEDGLKFNERVRKISSDIGIIIHSARNSDLHIDEGYSSGADIYITKPASINELYQALKTIIDRKNYTLKNEFQNIKLFTSSFKLSCAENETSLSTSQVALLVSFARSQNKLLETWQIAEVLEMNLDNLSRTSIELHISRLRKKIQSISSASNPISSIRDVGYRLNMEVLIFN